MAVISGFEGRFHPVSRAPGRMWKHSSPHLLQQRTPHHPHIGQRNQHVQLHRVLGQAPVAHLHVAELSLDHPERVFNLGTGARLGLLQLGEDRAHRRALVQRLALDWSHSYMPVDIDALGLCLVVHALLACVGQHMSSSACTSACACVTTLTLTVVPTTLCSKPESASTSIWAFIPKCH